MPLPGLPLGHGLAGTLGHAARWIGATLPIAGARHASAGPRCNGSAGRWALDPVTG